LLPFLPVGGCSKHALKKGVAVKNARQGFIAATDMKLEGLAGSTVVSQHTSGTLHQVLSPVFKGLSK
jgi:hypothetical protein